MMRKADQLSSGTGRYVATTLVERCRFRSGVENESAIAEFGQLLLRLLHEQGTMTATTPVRVYHYLTYPHGAASYRATLGLRFTDQAPHELFLIGKQAKRVLRVFAGYVGLGEFEAKGLAKEIAPQIAVRLVLKRGVFNRLD